MIGVLFTDLIDMIEAQYSPAIADAILTPPGLASRGVYTSVGVYEYREFNQLLERFAAQVGANRTVLLQQFGRFHFIRLMRLYPHLVAGLTDTFSLLARIDHPIHSTVVSLHVNAEVPHITFERQSPVRARLEYRSVRPLADVAEGLIVAAIAHFKEQIQIERVDYAPDGSQDSTNGEIGRHACFILTKAALQ
jgi:Haem-NO-binding